MASGRSREIKAIAAALGAHVLLLGLASRRALVAPAVAPPPPEPPADTLEIETTPATPPAPPSPEGPAPAEPAPESPAAPAGAKTAPRALEEAPAARAPTPGAAEQRPAESPVPTPPAGSPPPEAPAGERGGSAPGPGKPPGDEYGGPPSGGPITGLPPGLGEPLWSLPGVLPPGAPNAPAPTSAPQRPLDPEAATKAINGSLRTRDKELGIEIPAAGAVATSLANAVRSGGPLDARATFEVNLSADGRVEGVRLVSASAGDASTWERVVNAAKGALAARAMQMGSDAKGVTVVVKIESSVEYPAGSKEAVRIKPVCANEVIEQIESMIKDATQPGMARGVRDDAGNFIPYSAMDDDQRRRFCIPIGIGGTFDMSNIGAHATNVVRSSFKVVRAGEKALQSDAVRPLDTRLPGGRLDPTKVRAPPPKKKKKKKKHAEW